MESSLSFTHIGQKSIGEYASKIVERLNSKGSSKYYLKDLGEDSIYSTRLVTDRCVIKKSRRLWFDKNVGFVSHIILADGPGRTNIECNSYEITQEELKTLLSHR